MRCDMPKGGSGEPSGLPSCRLTPPGELGRPSGRHGPPQAGGRKDPQFRGGPFSGEIAAFGVIRNLEWHTPFAGLRARCLPREDGRQGTARGPAGRCADLEVGVPVPARRQHGRGPHLTPDRRDRQQFAAIYVVLLGRKYEKSGLEQGAPVFRPASPAQRAKLPSPSEQKRDDGRPLTTFVTPRG